MMYVTLEQAKSQIEIDHDASDSLIMGYILSASASVKAYLKSASPYAVELDSNDDPVLDSNGDVVYVRDSNGKKEVNMIVQQAVLLLVAIYFKDRDENADAIFEQGYLPKPVTALLYPLRDPALA
ncbi:phage gp6-like head-tail connector protein [Pseudomonas aeruginosa]|nr:phage gp6-like head-tail connector protein [Pseudomonas aeruginosa]MCO2660445.1 phage gp6-like head-tail connector protein [Pseudomonas aeruginosa]